METTITMSGKEAPRPGILRSLNAGLITNRQAAEALGLTIRHVQRLKRRFATGRGRPWCTAAGGQPSPQRLAPTVRAQIVHLMSTRYEALNDVHRTEKLQEVHGLHVSRSSAESSH
jgi:hypothetical protein